MATRPRKAVRAEVVSVDPTVEPVKAEIVSDKRPTLGKRLGFFAFALLVLFFAINGYIRAAKDAHLLHDANRDRTALTHSINHLTKANEELLRLVRNLQVALRAQNQLLQKHGIKTVVVPRSNDNGGTQSIPNNPPNGHKQTPKHHHDKNSHHHKPNNGHKPHQHKPPPHKPGPIEKTKNKVCEITGVCLTKQRSVYVLSSEQQGLRCPQVYCASRTTGFWWVIFRSVANLGFSTWG